MAEPIGLAGILDLFERPWIEWQDCLLSTSFKIKLSVVANTREWNFGDIQTGSSGVTTTAQREPSYSFEQVPLRLDGPLAGVNSIEFYSQFLMNTL